MSPLVNIIPVEIGPALLELARAYDRRTRLLLAEISEREKLSAAQAEGLHEVVFPPYDFGPSPVAGMLLDRIVSGLRGEEQDAPSGMISVSHAEEIVREEFEWYSGPQIKEEK